MPKVFRLLRTRDDTGVMLRRAKREAQIMINFFSYLFESLEKFYSGFLKDAVPLWLIAVLGLWLLDTPKRKKCVKNERRI